MILNVILGGIIQITELKLQEIPIIRRIFGRCFRIEPQDLFSFQILLPCRTVPLIDRLISILIIGFQADRCDGTGFILVCFTQIIIACILTCLMLCLQTRVLQRIN